MDRNHTLIASLRALLSRSDAFRRLVSTAGVELTGASVEARALVLATVQETTRRRLAIVVPGDASIDDFTAALQLFHRDPQCVLTYPSPALSPYQDVSPSLGVVRDEIRALGRLVNGESDVLIIPVRALFVRVPRAEAFAARVVQLAEGIDLDMRDLLERLVENGFVRTDLVGEAGEFAFRGGILDLFPPNTTRPVRIELFGDTIDSLRWFDVETQRSEEASGPVAVLPMTHFPATRALRQ
jgi:transcription-repair coupling factor (superfamily II helicase)